MRARLSSVRCSLCRGYLELAQCRDDRLEPIDFRCDAGQRRLSVVAVHEARRHRPLAAVGCNGREDLPAARRNGRDGRRLERRTLPVDGHAKSCSGSARPIEHLAEVCQGAMR